MKTLLKAQHLKAQCSCCIYIIETRRPTAQHHEACFGRRCWAFQNFSEIIELSISTINNARTGIQCHSCSSES